MAAATPEAGPAGGGLLPTLNWLILFFAMSTMVQKFMAPPPVGVSSDRASLVSRRKPACLWAKGTIMDLDVIVSDSPSAPVEWVASDSDRTSLSIVNPRRTRVRIVDHEEETAVLAHWREQGLVLGGGSSSSNSWMSQFSSQSYNQQNNHRNTTVMVPLTPLLWSNQTHLYAHVRLTRQRVWNKSHNNNNNNNPPADLREDVLIKRVALTKHKRRKNMKREKNLLDSQHSDSPNRNSNNNDTRDTVRPLTSHSHSSLLTNASLNKTHDQILLYIKPSLTLQLVDVAQVDFPSRESIPRQFSDHMDWYQEQDKDAAVGSRQYLHSGDYYYPIIYASEFWITSDSLKEVNESLKESKIEMRFEPASMWKWQLQAGMEDSWRKQEAFTGEEDTTNDLLRTMLVETNPYLLGITAIVSMLHTVFDILAFKNDISFFKNKKSMEGISLRSMIVNCFFSLVILLYLADNDTSFMVLASNGVGLIIDLWKISKAITIRIDGGKIQWIEAQSYKKSRTKEYDEVATSHLLFVTMPLVTGYGAYSLMFQKHKGWYSWILNTLVGFIYMFGFVMMTPQLFINYKLQSVAHLNWRTMTYKSINTFIDDLFAFVIKMPIMHRLACLRDDVVFFIFCYQRYKYKTDYTRVNEFGQCAQPNQEMLMEQREEEKLPDPGIVAEGGKDAMQQSHSDFSGMTRRRGARDKRE